MANPNRKKILLPIAVVDPYSASVKGDSNVGDVPNVTSFAINNDVDGYSILTNRGGKSNAFCITRPDSANGAINTLTINKETPLFAAAYILGADSEVGKLASKTFDVKVAASTLVNQWGTVPPSLNLDWLKWRGNWQSVTVPRSDEFLTAAINIDGSLIGGTGPVRLTGRGKAAGTTHASTVAELSGFLTGKSLMERDAALAMKIAEMTKELKISERFETDNQRRYKLNTLDTRMGVYWYEGRLIISAPIIEQHTFDVALPTDLANQPTWETAQEVHMINGEAEEIADRRCMDAMLAFEKTWLKKLHTLSISPLGVTSAEVATISASWARPADTQHNMMSHARWDRAELWWSTWNEVITQVIATGANTAGETARKEALWNEFLRKNPNTGVTKSQFLSNPAQYLGDPLAGKAEGSKDWFDTILDSIGWLGDKTGDLLTNDSIVGGLIGAGAVGLADDELRPWLFGGAALLAFAILK